MFECLKCDIPWITLLINTCAVIAYVTNSSDSNNAMTLCLCVTEYFFYK